MKRLTAVEIETNPSAYRRGVHALAIVAAAFTWPLLLSGGQVTTYRVGMAVPDWPTTFGINMFLYRFVDSTWGVFIEHRHRLLGAGLGLISIVLAVWFTLRERRLGVKLLGWGALAGVVLQGLLGGLRVRNNSTELALVHGCSGQAVFGVMVALAVVTSRKWIDSAANRDESRGTRAYSLGFLILVYAQIVIGAILRHFGSMLIVHVCMAVCVIVAGCVLSVSVRSSERERTAVRAAAARLSGAIAAQGVLGVSAWWMLRPFDSVARRVTTWQAIARTGHQGTGALVLGAAVSLALWAWRPWFARVFTSSSDTFGSTTSVSVRELEVVA